MSATASRRRSRSLGPPRNRTSREGSFDEDTNNSVTGRRDRALRREELRRAEEQCRAEERSQAEEHRAEVHALEEKLTALKSLLNNKQCASERAAQSTSEREAQVASAREDQTSEREEKSMPSEREEQGTSAREDQGTSEREDQTSKREEKSASMREVQGNSARETPRMKADVEPDDEEGHDTEIEKLKRNAERAQKALENKMAEKKTSKPRQRKNRTSAFCKRARIPVLLPSKANFSVWSLRVKAMLRQQYLGCYNMWDDVVNNPKIRESTDDDWNDLNEEAMMFLGQVISDACVARVQRYTLASEWWSVLKPPNTLEAADLEVETMKKKRLHAYPTLEDYLDSMEDSYAIIIGCEGGTDLMTEHSYLITVINGVRGNPHYDHARTQLYSLYDDNKVKFTMTEVRKRLKAASLRISPDEERARARANQASYTTKKNNKFGKSDWHKTAKCFGCGKKGHIKRDCKQSRSSDDESDNEDFNAQTAQFIEDDANDEIYLSF